MRVLWEGPYLYIQESLTIEILRVDSITGITLQYQPPQITIWIGERKLQFKEINVFLPVLKEALCLTKLFAIAPPGDFENPQ